MTFFYAVFSIKSAPFLFDATEIIDVFFAYGSYEKS